MTLHFEELELMKKFDAMNASLMMYWDEKLIKACTVRSFFYEPPPPLTRFQKARKAIAYHLYHRWKTLRFGFYRKCTCREDW